MAIPLIAGIGVGPSNSAVTVTGFVSGWGWSTVNFPYYRQCIAAGGKIKHLRVDLGTAPGAGNKFTFTLYKNGSPTTLEVEISGTATTGADLTHEVAVSPGDVILFYSTPDSSPASGDTRWTARFEPTLADEFPILGIANSSAGSIYECVFQTGTPNNFSVGGAGQLWVPCAGFLQGFYVDCVSSPGGGIRQFTFTIWKNGVETDCVVEIIGDAKTGYNLVDSVTVMPGDYFSIRTKPQNSPLDGSYSAVGIGFYPFDSGLFPCMNMRSTPIASANGLYQQAVGHYSPSITWQAAFARRAQLISACKIENFYLHLTAAPGAGKKVKLEFYKNGVATGYYVEVADAATDAHNTTGELECLDGDLIAVRCLITGAVSTTPRAFWSFTVSEGVKRACYGLHAGAMAEMLS